MVSGQVTTRVFWICGIVYLLSFEKVRPVHFTVQSHICLTITLVWLWCGLRTSVYHFSTFQRHLLNGQPLSVGSCYGCAQARWYQAQQHATDTRMSPGRARSERRSNSHRKCHSLRINLDNPHPGSSLQRWKEILWVITMNTV